MVLKETDKGGKRHEINLKGLNLHIQTNVCYMIPAYHLYIIR